MPYSRIARRLDDPGLQPERTSLSWSRTSFVIIGVSILFFRLGMNKRDATLITGSIVLLLSNFGIYIYAYKRNLLNTKNATLTSNSSVIVKRIMCFAIVFSAFVFSISNAINLVNILSL